ncbi:MAG: hypothetical protein AB1716_04110 [Planctomycetota bacterium]
MSEGRAYRCGWAREPDGRVRLWVKDAPRVSAEGPTWFDAELNLIEKIGERTGDGEPVLAYLPPPLAEDDLRFLNPPLMTIDGCGYCGSPDDARLHYEGRCGLCGHARGGRTATTITLSSLEAQLLQTPQEWWFFAGPMFVSARFRGLLTAVERECCEWRPVMRPPRARLKYFEVIPHVFVRQAALRGREVGGWRCPRCGRCAFSQHGDDNRIGYFVARRDLPQPLPPVFGIGDPVNYKLVFDRDRALALAESPAARGAMLAELGVLDEEDIDPAEPARLYNYNWRTRIFRDEPPIVCRRDEMYSDGPPG